MDSTCPQAGARCGNDESQAATIKNYEGNYNSPPVIPAPGTRLRVVESISHPSDNF
jgi:hypothetical protein